MEGLKNNIEISQMKEKVEAAQALDAAKDELKVLISLYLERYSSLKARNATRIRSWNVETHERKIKQRINSASSH